MNELAVTIEYLLLSRNSVIVPGLGAFTTRTFASQWMDEEEIFLPPVRHIRFNADIFQDPEEFFQSSLSQIFGLTKEEAHHRCEEMVAEFHKTLVIEGTVDFGSIGLFTLEDDAEITMSPYECGVTSPNYYGLDTLHFPLLTNQPEEEECNAECDIPEHMENVDNTSSRHNYEKDESASPQTIILPKGKTYVADSKHIIIRLNRAMVHYTMVAAASIILFFLLGPNTKNEETASEVKKATTNLVLPSQPSSKKTTNSQDNTVHNIIESKPATTNGQLSETKEQDTEQKEESTIAESSIISEMSNDAEARKEIDNSQILNEIQGKYSIVLASAVSEANAKSFVKKLEERDIHAIIYTNGKMIRVLIDGFASAADAYNMNNYLHNLDKSFQSTWVMKN